MMTPISSLASRAGGGRRFPGIDLAGWQVPFSVECPAAALGEQQAAVACKQDVNVDNVAIDHGQGLSWLPGVGGDAIGNAWISHPGRYRARTGEAAPRRRAENLPRLVPKARLLSEDRISLA
jgi:hypothetical protein